MGNLINKIFKISSGYLKMHLPSI